MRLNFKYLLGLGLMISAVGRADENFLGYVKGAETLPAKAIEVYQIVTTRNGKNLGSYRAINTETEVEYGITPKFSAEASLSMQSIRTQGIVLDGYVPKDESYGLKPSGISAGFKYNFLSPVTEVVGLSTYFEIDHSWLDRHSGQKKRTTSAELMLILQKYLLDDTLIWNANFGYEATFAKREYIANLPANFEWPLEPEMEIEVQAGTGVSYRVMSNWFVGAETLYEAEFETEIGRERWSVFAGPSLHYATQNWWATLTYFNQLEGGGVRGPEQPDNLQLIEKTKEETRLKVGLNF